MLEPGPRRRSPHDIVRELKASERGAVGFIYRNRVILIAIVVSLALGGYLQPLFVAYRGVVLSFEGDSMLVRRSDNQLMHVDRYGELGDILEKRRGSFTPEVVPASPADAPLIAFYARYQERYDGVVEALAPPRVEGSVGHVTLRVDGARREYDVFDPAWQGAKLGQRVVKRRGSWEPLPDAGPNRAVKLEAP